MGGLLRMMKDKKIVVTGTRRIDEMTAIVHKLGGIPVLRPLHNSVFHQDDEIAQALRTMIFSPPDYVLFTTGFGAQRLYDVAIQEKIDQEWLAMLHHTKLIVRGYKTAQVLKGLGLKISIRDVDGTVASVIDQLIEQDVEGKTIDVQLYGEMQIDFTKRLSDRKAVVREIAPYHQTDTNQDVMQALLQDIIDHRVDAVTFTSSTQVKTLIHAMHANDRGEKVIEAFNRQMPIAVAIGKVTTQTLRDEGIEEVIYPETERMGAMLVELAKYFDDLDENS